MGKSISIIGGDLRNFFLAEIMAGQGHDVSLIGFDKLKNSNDAGSNLKMKFKTDVIVGPVPFSDNHGNIYAPHWSNEMSAGTFLDAANNASLLVAGTIDAKYLDQLKVDYFDISRDENYALSNAIPTVEGIVQIAISETQHTLHGSKILVLGFGRIGKRAAMIFVAMGAWPTIASGEETELKIAQACGYSVVNLYDLEKKHLDYSLLVNTIPCIYITEKVLKNISKDALIIDVASAPGGVDTRFASANGFKVYAAKGIPGRIAPKSVAYYMANIINKRINQEHSEF